MDISKLLSTIKVEESDTDVFVYIGYIRICSIYEENGRWYPDVQGTELMAMNGCSTKQEALDIVIKHLTD